MEKRVVWEIAYQVHVSHWQVDTLQMQAKTGNWYTTGVYSRQVKTIQDGDLPILCPGQTEAHECRA